MKRTALTRRTPLKRSRLRRRAVTVKPDPRRDEFKRVRDGICKVCGRRGLVRRHHVITEQRVRQEGGDLWALPNGLWIGLGSESGELQTCDCHAQHHSKAQRIPLAVLSLAAISFADDLLGRDAAGLYFERHYACEERA